MIEFIIFIVVLVILFASRYKKHTPPKISQRQKQADELISIILPIIKDKK